MANLYRTLRLGFAETQHCPFSSPKVIPSPIGAFDLLWTPRGRRVAISSTGA
jgi:hypothetical protein